MRLVDLSKEPPFGHLTALSHRSRHTGKRTISEWLCKCACGAEKYVSACNLTNGRVKTCAGKTCPFARAILANRITRNGQPYYVPGPQHIFASYRRKALNKGREFTLSRDQFCKLIESDCHYCGSPPTNVSKRGPGKQTEYLYNGVDRVDSKIGYITSNVRPCCWKCNCMKSTLSESDFLAHVKLICQRQKL